MKTNDILLEKGAASPSTSPSPTAASEAAPAGRTPLSAAESPAAPAPSAPARPLPKRIALITGGSSGLGREFAVQIDAMQVVDEIWLVARKEEALKAVAATLSTPARTVVADLTSKADITSIVSTLNAEQPRVSYLVNAAGFGKFGDWQTISDEAVDAMIDLNCRGLVDMTRAALPSMDRGSRIIEVASAAAFVPLPHMNVYAATKAFVLRYTRALRWELHGTGITATALCPTWVKTGFEKVARTSGGAHDVGHLFGEQSASTVVRRALCANKAHLAVACASPQSAALRLIGKVVPDCVTMAGWNILRRL